MARRKRCERGGGGIESAGMSGNRKVRLRWGVFWLVTLVVAWPGCDDKRRHRTSEGMEFAAVQAGVPRDAEPAEVVRAFLAALREAQHVRERGLRTAEDKERYGRAMGRVSSLAARRATHKNMLQKGTGTVPVGITEDAALTIISESWVSTVAYYVDGILFETLKVLPENPDPAVTSGALAFVDAEPPQDQARLSEIKASDEVANAKDPDGRPLVEGSEAYAKLVRRKTLALDRGFNTPIRARLEIRLRYEEGAWRVSGLGLGPVPKPRPTTFPATSQAFPATGP